MGVLCIVRNILLRIIFSPVEMAEVLCILRMILYYVMYCAALRALEAHHILATLAALLRGRDVFVCVCVCVCV